MWRKEELLDNCLTIGAGACAVGTVATARHVTGYTGLIPFPVPDLLKGLNLMETRFNFHILPLFNVYKGPIKS